MIYFSLALVGRLEHLRVGDPRDDREAQVPEGTRCAVTRVQDCRAKGARPLPCKFQGAVPSKSETSLEEVGGWSGI